MLQQNPLTRLQRHLQEAVGFPRSLPLTIRSPDGKLTEDFSPVPIYMQPGILSTMLVANKLMHICPSGAVQTEWSPEQETNPRQMECLSEGGCKSRSKICKTGGDK